MGTQYIKTCMISSLVGLLFYGCTNSTVILGDNNAMKQTKLKAEKYYDAIKHNEFEKTIPLFHDTIKKSGMESGFIKRLNDNKIHFGNLKQFKLVDSLQIVDKTDNSENILLIIRLNYDKVSLDEGVSFIKKSSSDSFGIINIEPRQIGGFVRK